MKTHVPTDRELLEALLPGQLEVTLSGAYRGTERIFEPRQQASALYDTLARKGWVSVSAGEDGPAAGGDLKMMGRGVVSQRVVITALGRYELDNIVGDDKTKAIMKEVRRG